MIELLIAALLQATDPQIPPPETTASETTSQTPTTDEAAAAAADVEVPAAPERSARRCEEAAPTGSRVRTRRVTCTTQDSRDAAAEASRRIANSGGAGGQAGEMGRGH